MVLHEEKVHLFFSAFFHEDGMERSHVVHVKTTDFKEYSEPLSCWRGKEEGWIGMCSPNISVIDGAYYLTYNSWGDKRDKPNQLFMARSTDMVSWKIYPLAHEITKNERAIDAALVKDRAGRYILFYKKNQEPVAAWTRNLHSGPWTSLGKVSGGLVWFENSQLIEIDGKWHLLCKTQMNGASMGSMIIEEPSSESCRLEDWTRFIDFRMLDIPVESFNTRSHANAPFLVDWRDRDGYFYLLYAGSTEGNTHAGRGDNKLGLARSHNLVSWEVPPGS